MALQKCHECGNDVSTEAKQCPKCGAKVKKGISRGAKLLFGFLAFIVIASAVTEAMKSPEQLAKDAKTRAEGKKTSNHVASCQSAWESTFQSSMQDPDSLEWDRRNSTFGTIKQGKKIVPVVIVPFRAKNGFGAKTLEQAVCAIDPEDDKKITVIK